MLGRQKLSLQAVSELVDQYDVFRHYCTGFDKIGKLFKSEIRDDKNPTCCIKRFGDKLLYRDFSDVGNQDCYGYIQMKYNCGFYEALEMINRDFSLNLDTTVSIQHVYVQPVLFGKKLEDIEESRTEIKVKTRKWNLNDKEYWSTKYGFTSKDLEHFNIFPISWFWINGVDYKAQKNAYAFYFGLDDKGGQIWKIYQPKKKIKGKWFSNVTDKIFQGYNQLPETGDVLFITKSLKDVVALYKLGIPAIAPQGEAMKFTFEFIQELKSRFKKVVMLYDNDKPGIFATFQNSVWHGLDFMFLHPDSQKDPSDFIEEYDLLTLKHYINNYYGYRFCGNDTELPMAC